MTTTARTTAFALAIIALLIATGCAGIQLPDDRNVVFTKAVEASLDNSPEYAATAAYHYVFTGTQEDPRYDRALRLLALNAEKLGFSYAASLWYLDIAQAGRDVELMAEAILGLETIIHTYPYDSQTLLAGFIATHEISGLPAAQQAFVDYYQGRDSARRGLNEWADSRFANIPKTSPYHARARFVQTVRLIAESNLDEAQTELAAILELEVVPEEVKTEVQRSLARIAFKEKRFDDALEFYETIRSNAHDDPVLLLEMAWAHYYRGESRRALGLLIALDAPAYRKLIAPERYLLEALSLRRLCQFEPARKAATRLRYRHGNALEDLYAGIPLRESAALRAAAGLRTGGRDIARFRKRIKSERAKLDALKDDIGPELHGRLTEIYNRGLTEVARAEDAQLASEMETLAQELLSAEEGVRLILHELGVALLRGRRRPEGIDERISLRASETQTPVLYTFDGEFWTDELDDLVVTVKDRCID